MGKLIVAGVLVFAGILAVFIGTRLSEDALGLMAGVVLGVLASLPVSVLLFWGLMRRSDPSNRRDEQQPMLPPIINVGTPGSYFAPWQQQHDYPPALPPAPDQARQFKEVGAEYEE